MPENNNNTLTPQISFGEIYEGGALNPISIDELLGNKVAIRQLVNEVNHKNQQIDTLSEEITSLKSDIVGLRNQTLIRWQDAIFNAIGAIVLAIGTNILSTNIHSAIVLMSVGAACIIIVNVWGVIRTKRK